MGFIVTSIELWLAESIYTSPLSPACKLCAEGAKMVMLITGLCPASCFYCPLSFKKGGHDLIFADEWQLDDEHDTDVLIKEADLIDAKGAGITGGDPLSVPQRTIQYIELLKQKYGKTFHIHLYTSGLVHYDVIADLASVGLDEIRFHPMPKDWNHMESSPCESAIKHALDTEMDVAIEIPVIPTMKEEIMSLIRWADNVQVNWLNLNELEFSERNEKTLHTRGFEEKNEISAAVKNSQEVAYQLVERVVESGLDIGVHYCSSSFKDGVQLKNRMLRRARNIANPLDIITEDATIMKGIIQTFSPQQLRTIIDYLIEEYDIQKEDYFIISNLLQIQVSLSFIETFADHLVKKGVQCFISEQYPTRDQLEVERIPLPYHVS